MGFFDNWDWSKIINGVVASAPAAITGYVGARGVANANQRAAELASRNRDANLAAITAGNERAGQMLRPIADQATTGIDYLRSVMAQNPYQLTPQQGIELADRRRAAVTATPSGLRGSGRYLTASINDVENRGRAGMIDANTRRADAAGGDLARIGAGATTNMASLSSGQGRDIATINTGAATDQANAITSTAASNAKTLGDITSYFANAVKEGDRESRYGKTKATLEGR